MAFEEQGSGSFAARPFISHDGGDADGVRAEVEVQTGTAPIMELDNKGRTAQLRFQPDNLKYPISGWINTNSEAFRIAEAQYKAGLPIDFRIEKQRLPFDKETKQPISRKTTMKELIADPATGKNSNDLSKRRIKRLLVGVAVPGEQMHFVQAQTSPKEDAIAKGGVTGASALDLTDEQLAELERRSAANAAGPATVAAAGPQSDVESPEWSQTNADGKANPGARSVRLVADLYLALRRGIPELDPTDADEHTAERNRKLLGKMLSSLVNGADKMQVDVYNDVLRKPDRNLASWGTAIGLLKESLADNPFPAGKLSDGSKLGQVIPQWLHDVNAYALDIWRTSYTVNSNTQHLDVEAAPAADDDRQDDGDYWG